MKISSGLAIRSSGGFVGWGSGHCPAVEGVPAGG